MKDLVISAIANYLPEKIKIYVESLNDSGFIGDKIMICYNIPNETIEYLSSRGWECLGAELQGHPHMKRLIDMWYFLDTTDRQWNHIITTDVRDIFWQSNPSDWLDTNLKTEIIVASECIKNEDEPWAHKNIHEGYGPVFWESIKSNTIANVGVIAGKHKSVKDLLMLNWLVSQAGDTRHFTDQSALNLIVNNTLLKDKIEINSDFAMQVDTLKSDKRFEKQNLTIKEGLVINTKDETPYVLVHQYDRIEQLNNLIENKYK
jgi:hypothetical protein